MSAIIEIRNLRKVYRAEAKVPGEETPEVHALGGVDLTIERGDFVAVIGQSGSGKSTLMQILGLLDRKTSGDYILDGEDISNFDDEKLAHIRSTKIGFIFQFFNLLPRTSATDNVCLPMLYAGNTNPLPRAQELLKMVGLEKRLNHKPHQLSGGQQQRVAIARSLANHPSIIFADEPTGNISSEQSEEILAMLSKLNHQGVTIVLVTHEPDVADRANRILHLRDGHVFSDTRHREIVYQGDGQEHREAVAASPAAQPRRWQRLRENLRMAAIALSLNKIRTALATLGIVIGVGSVVAMVAVGQGARRNIEEELSTLGTNVITVWPTVPRSNSNMASEFKYRKFTPEDLDALKAVGQSPTSPIGRVGGSVGGWVEATRGPRNMWTEVRGATASYEQMQNLKLTAGRYFTEEEDQRRDRVLLIGQLVMKNLFGENFNPVGAIVKVNGVEFRVVGVLSAHGATSAGDQDNMLILPLRTVMYRVLGLFRVENLVISAKSEAQVPEAIAAMEELLRYRRQIRPGQDSDFNIKSLNEIRATAERSSNAIAALLAAIASISLLVGGIGIMNVMLVSVKERTREIGLRKALGAKAKDVMSQFLVESIVICLLGGFIGLVLGYVLSFVAALILGWPASIPASAAALAFGFSLFVGVVFGLWPAKQASRLSPIEALRYE